MISVSVAVSATMSRLLAIAILLAVSSPVCTGFVPSLSVRGRAIASIPNSSHSRGGSTPLQLQASSSQLLVDTLDSLATSHGGDGGMMLTSSSIILSETEAWVQPLSFVLGPFLTFFSFAMLCRIVLSWYPSASVNEFPFSIVVWPTEPLLRLIRGSIPPAFGVDITPVVWLGLFSFMNEIFLGQQGLLTMKMKYGI
ncbi:hypothetical protein ACHAWU_000784 [Discostella pseudostelligera]|uniref:Uncharacterized protein n=1 Tax=Discostella pseudostelligera TaxID=259834 RepID=A0ABD3M603_9STRA